MHPAPVADRYPPRSRPGSPQTETRIHPVSALDIPLTRIQLISRDAVPGVYMVIHPGMHALPDDGARIVVEVKISQPRGIILPRLVVLRDKKAGRTPLDILVVRSHQHPQPA